MNWEDYRRADGSIILTEFFTRVMRELSEPLDTPGYAIAVKYIALVEGISLIKSRQVAATIIAHAMMLYATKT